MPTSLLTRVLLSVLAGALVGVVVTCGLVVTGGPDVASLARSATAPRAGPDPATPSTPGTPSTARETLRLWDAARAAAWTTGDTAALARLYTPGSVAGRRDVAMLRAWNERGARLRDLTTQVLRLQVLTERPRRLEVVVTDRVAAVAADGTTLPQDRPTTRRLVLVRAAAAPWRVAAVSTQP